MDDFSSFIQEGAKFMAADRPDLFTVEDAVKTLSSWFSDLSSHDAENDDDIVSVGTGGFELHRSTISNGVVEYMLARNVLSFTTFDPEGEAGVFNWTAQGALVDINLNIDND